MGEGGSSRSKRKKQRSSSRYASQPPEQELLPWDESQVEHTAYVLRRLHGIALMRDGVLQSAIEDGVQQPVKEAVQQVPGEDLQQPPSGTIGWIVGHHPQLSGGDPMLPRSGSKE
eukprot:scaffold277407_cov17-Tisochrysis_lutea.AAC.1